MNTQKRDVLIRTGCPMPIMAEIAIRCKVGVLDRYNRGIWLRYQDLPIIEARLNGDLFNNEVTIADFKALFEKG